ncbi:AcvB/VirJ family lysyl-phosphatidylglycerol hydrolase [Luteitalea pratensis]|uniref:AcvB/VirJ family lysyl-phosphatidylglycerol hydrolase n=1 Tax=Luteitalea pratensis TaxID=1855912 RepID=UPI0012FF8A14|nr:AcvB/VirJ family lysyl-phosphatidylglycerol hydrolase [Luteitalea pratensis]
MASSGWPARVREGSRRLAAGLVLLLAAGIGVGDDLRSAPGVRLGTREVMLDLPHLGTSAVQIPRASATGVVLMLHRGGSRAERSALTQAIPSSVLLIDVDATRLEMPQSAACAFAAAILEDVSRRAQRDAGLKRYLPPVVLATPGALGFAGPAMAGASPGALPAAVSVGAPIEHLPHSCGADPARGAANKAPWLHASNAHTLRTPLEEALAMAALEPQHDATPVQRWLRHFDLPLTAAWSSRPRGMLVLLSPARGWRQPEEALAQRLASAGIHVVGIDALHSFWQRRSPRDVALELQRLTDALASTGLPVYIGGREFGAETMAVAGEMMTPARKIAGVVLVDPGPTAFFEVEPPALALRPTGPSDWSTRAAVTGLDRPTLCVAHAAPANSSLLCRSLAGRGQATLAQTGADATALANTIARFILDR